MLKIYLKILVTSVHLFISGTVIEINKNYIDHFVSTGNLSSKRTINRALKLQHKINKFRKLEKHFSDIIKNC